MPTGRPRSAEQTPIEAIRPTEVPNCVSEPAKPARTGVWLPADALLDAEHEEWAERAASNGK